jgi:hypothetical protein
MAQPLQILALLSDPLVGPDGQPVDRLGLAREVERVCAQLSALDRAAQLDLEVATPTSLLNALNRHGPFDVLHFKGHGRQYLLAFEDDHGTALRVDETTLRTILGPLGNPPCQVAFLSACHSQSMADALADIGVPHVVAIGAPEELLKAAQSDEEREMLGSALDVSARAFAAQFYPVLLAGRSVRQAFDFGRAAIRSDATTRDACRTLARLNPQLAALFNQETEERKFQLLPEHEPGTPDPHAVVPFPDVPPGALQVRPPPEPPVALGITPEFFTGRERDLHGVVNRVLEHRLTTVVGGGGIGKSELAREGGRWFVRREHFPGGIHFVSLGNAATAAEARLAIATALKLEPALAADDRALAHALPEGCLLILDELDSLCFEHLRATRTLMEALCQAGRCRVLTTSRQPTGVAGEQRHELRRLPPEAARRLFLGLAQPQTGGVQGSEAELGEVLAFLDGVPRAIHLAARQMTTPDLSPLLADLRRAREELLRDPDLPEAELRDHESVLVTLESSYRRLAQRDPQAADFFPRLALFPAGVGDQGMVDIFGPNARRLVRVIHDLSLLEVTPLDYYYLPAPVRSYAGRKLVAAGQDAIM